MSHIPAASRRRFLALAARAGLGASLPLASLLGLVGCREQRGGLRSGGITDNGYGPLQPVADETTGKYLLKLPAGFRYRTMGWVGSRLRNGDLTPYAHDGMGIVAAQGSRLTLIRNHEMTMTAGAFGDSLLHYEAPASGGCIAFDFDSESGEASDFRAVLGGTMQNCSGGITPWGTWLSCEEMVFDPSSGRDDNGVLRPTLQKIHGYVFEVHPSGTIAPQCIPAMGVFKHEAAAVDTRSGAVYQTEDFHQESGFYRYLPTTPGQLARGGKLQMLACAERKDFIRGLQPGQSWRTHWVDVPDPERVRHSNGRIGGGVFEQGQLAGGAAFTRLEGCFAQGRVILFTSTNGGDLGHGQLFAYHLDEERLVLLYETTSLQTLDYPDNVCASPRGGLVICEDNKGGNAQKLVGMNADAELFDFAENQTHWPDNNGKEIDYSGAEWAGACFSPDGRWLFANIYRPGFTVAITGPWGEGKI